MGCGSEVGVGKVSTAQIMAGMDNGSGLMHPHAPRDSVFETRSWHLLLPSAVTPNRPSAPF